MLDRRMELLADKRSESRLDDGKSGHHKSYWRMKLLHSSTVVSPLFPGMLNIVSPFRGIPAAYAWCLRFLFSAEAVRRAHQIQDMLFRKSPRELTTASVLEAFSDEPRLKRVRWSDIKDVPVSKLAVVFGLCKSRGAIVILL